jgi:phosphatidylglycerophosphate synthase
MFDPLMRRVIDPVVNPIGGAIARTGLGANAVTLIGLAIGLGGAVALAYRQEEVALACILINRLFDGLDGAVARHGRRTAFGGYLDIVADFVFYSGIVFGFAVGRPDHAIAAAFLIYSFIGTGGSFLAFAILAAQHGLTTMRRGHKTFYYAAGLAEGTETVSVLVLICLVPAWFDWIAYGFAIACWITTVSRTIEAAILFNRPDPPEDRG